MEALTNEKEIGAKSYRDSILRKKIRSYFEGNPREDRVVISRNGCRVPGTLLFVELDCQGQFGMHAKDGSILHELEDVHGPRLPNFFRRLMLDLHRVYTAKEKPDGIRLLSEPDFLDSLEKGEIVDMDQEKFLSVRSKALGYAEEALRHGDEEEAQRVYRLLGI